MGRGTVNGAMIFIAPFHCYKTIFFPSYYICVNIFPYFLIILFVTNYVVMTRCLPNVFTIFTVTISF